MQEERLQLNESLMCTRQLTLMRMPARSVRVRLKIHLVKKRKDFKGPKPRNLNGGGFVAKRARLAGIK